MKKKQIKLLLFSLLSMILLFGAAEIAVRALSLGGPRYVAGGSGLGPDSLMKLDQDLGWSLLPDSHSDRGRWSVTTNSLGLRSPEILDRQTDEFRILSLGESTTFGMYVRSEETYSALLQKFLDEQLSRPVTVVNAGISAYSSYQSVKYLELRGLSLQPDLILFYHEVNDYLPSVIRDHRLSELGILKTDKELYESSARAWNRWLLKKWALYGFLSRSVASYRIKRLASVDIANPVEAIGLPDIRVGQVAQVEDGIANVARDITPAALGRRVSDAERLENLTRLASLCRTNGIELIIVHPSYRDSHAHECLLTRLCREHNVLMYEAHGALHPENAKDDEMFVDLWHPTAGGHRALAAALADLVTTKILTESGASKSTRIAP